MEFNAKKNNNQAELFWKTSSEINNKLFIVEHSTDGIDFEIIGTREGAGNTAEVQTYNFTHQHPDFGTNYYRLKQVDFDENFEYSDIVQIKYNNSNNEIKVFPNPTYDKINFEVLPETTGTFEIYNQTGQLMQEEKNIDSENSFSLKQFPTGWYIIKFTTNNGVIFQRIFKH